MQINRLFEMIYLLLNKESMTAGELATHFEVSPRTIYRDVELLSSAGIPIYMTKGKGGGISLLPDFVLNKTVLTDGEKSDILAALHAVEAVNLEQTNTAVQKLSSLFGSTNADWVEVDFSGWANAEEEALLFSQLKTAILGKIKVVFHYHSSEGSTQRTVEPMKLCFKGQSWYLYAFCTVRQDYRFFKLRRMKELELMDDHFERTAPAKIFEDDKIFQDDFVTITLKLLKKMAYRVYDEFSQYKTLPDGDFIAQLTMPRGDWVYQYLATFGEHCEILEPEDIRLQVKKKLQKTLAQYL
ncbi:helix-turn-helix transcriptional regulator [Anaerotignum propionicum]|uniref:HTH domain protein n=1 Tax=Anaerotignum propionicum DSM 1682 TaxID=991789 RepID=A0A0X1U9C8_ANAPI|nr:YafY family protein [Anaerotignum propionicum]AMJ41521.1 HTH domain protein [Anaerotignum propionicum DSM 1682]SHE70468.1 Predicted DNA-binding transcriptional regulator YafY, contains an HTH and WYL domains [[Clostridium] propionicum DSM 1682] [Anaerotignum propionicum DSM 1682]